MVCHHSSKAQRNAITSTQPTLPSSNHPGVQPLPSVAPVQPPPDDNQHAIARQEAVRTAFRPLARGCFRARGHRRVARCSLGCCRTRSTLGRGLANCSATAAARHAREQGRGGEGRKASTCMQVESCKQNRRGHPRHTPTHNHVQGGQEETRVSHVR